MNSVPFKIIIPVQNDVSTFPNFEVFQMDPSYTIYGMLLEQKLTLSLQPSNAYSFTWKIVQQYLKNQTLQLQSYVYHSWNLAKSAPLS